MKSSHTVIEQQGNAQDHKHPNCKKQTRNDKSTFARRQFRGVFPPRSATHAAVESRATESAPRSGTGR